MWTGVGRFVVPKGRNDSSLAVYCLECDQRTTRPLGHGLSWSAGVFYPRKVAERSLRPNHIRRGGDGSFLGHIPGSKLPRYYHLVPPGQNPCRRTSFRIEDEDDDEYEDETDTRRIHRAKAAPLQARRRDHVAPGSWILTAGSFPFAFCTAPH
jgi:hypothetical protein